MSISKTLQQKRHAETCVFIRLHMAEAIASGASHIRSKRAAMLQAGIDEVRRDYAADFGENMVAAFLECIESWLSDRGNTVAATALRVYLERAVFGSDRASRLLDGSGFASGEQDDAPDDDIASPLLASTVAMYTTDGFATSDVIGGTRGLDGARVARSRPDARNEARLRTAAVASRAALRFADNGQAAHAHRSTRSR